MCYSLWYNAPTMLPAGSLEAEELWTMISPIFRSTRLCVTACGIMHPRCCRPVVWKRRKKRATRWQCSRIATVLPSGGRVVPPLPGYRPATSWVHYTTSCNTQSSAAEDGRAHRPKHVELIGIINKPLLLHLVGVYIICKQFSCAHKISTECAFVTQLSGKAGFSVQRIVWVTTNC